MMSMDVCANDAHIRAAADVPTVGQVSITGPKTLYVFANHGSLTISYHGENAIVSEGESYRVVLDPDDDANASSDPSAKKTTRSHRRLLLILGAATAAAMATTWIKLKDYESPDQP
jgi:hypothetical protein